MASPFLRFLDHTQRRTTLGRTPLDEWPATRRDLYLTTHNTYNRQTSMPRAEFEPTILASERPQNYASVGAAAGTGNQSVLSLRSHGALSCSPMHIYDLITALFITSNLSITETSCHMLVTPSYCTLFWVSCLILIGSRNMNDDNKPSAARSATMPNIIWQLKNVKRHLVTDERKDNWSEKSGKGKQWHLLAGFGMKIKSWMHLIYAAVYTIFVIIMHRVITKHSGRSQTCHMEHV